MATKRIHNPKTGKYYQIRQKSTPLGQKGQIHYLKAVRQYNCATITLKKLKIFLNIIRNQGFNFVPFIQISFITRGLSESFLNGFIIEADSIKQ